MIDWMQKHKNYLLVTIWISTIAFIGAGSIGWGDYSLSRSSSTVVTVGDFDINYNEVNAEYNRIFNLIKQKNPSFGNDEAKELNLEKTATDNIISRKYLLNFAKEIGMIATSNEIIASLASNNSFFIDDKFDKKNYKEILKQNNISPADYERYLSEDILINKVLDIFKSNLSSLEEKLSDVNTKLEDEVKIVVIDSKNIKVQNTQEEIKSFWEKSKQKYLSNTKYVLKTVEVKFPTSTPSKDKIEKYYNNNRLKFENKDGKIKTLEESKIQIVKLINKDIAQEKAKRLYYDIKNKKINTTTTITLDKSSDISRETFTQITSYKKGDFIKPIELKNKYIVGLLEDIQEPRIKTFEEAKEQVAFLLKDKTKLDKLEAQAKVHLEKFKGKLVGFISKENYFEKLESYNLDRYEANNFIFRLMGSMDKKGYFIIDKKAVVYEIVSQRLPSSSSETLSLNSLSELKNITQNDDTLLNTKNKLIQDSILNYFKTKYEVKYLANITSN